MKNFINAVLISASSCDPILSNASFAVSKPHEYFPQKIKTIVQKTDSISTKAIASPVSYPSIDITSFMDPDNSSQDEKDEIVRKVLMEAMGAGSFNIIGHNITIDFLDQLEYSARTFFGQTPDEEKKKYSNGDNKAGYVANQQERVAAIHKTTNQYEQKDLRENFSVIYPPEYTENVRGPDYFQDNLDKYIRQLQPVEIALTNIFTAALAMATGVDLPPSYLHLAEEGSTGLLRSSRYPAMPQEYDDANRLLAHSDFSTLTIIYATEKGLEEIRNDRWVEVPIKRGELHVSIGELYAMWSNEVFTNNIHRVGKNAMRDRVSFAYFFGQGQKSEGKGIGPVCRPGETAKFPSVSLSSHVKNYIPALLGKQ